MELSLRLDIPVLDQPIRHRDHIFLIGSCFTEHMADRLSQAKFRTLSNPHGILFNPISVCSSIERYIEGETYEADDLFLLNEVWNSWDHHTRFSDVDKVKALDRINSSQESAHSFILKADWVIITLGSAFQYYLKENNRPVANNHRAPAQWFEKRLLGIDEITAGLDRMLGKLFAANPYVRVLLTISPVRHIRDGVVDNNRSKARLIEAVHDVCTRQSRVTYFPAYELLIDVLRDYRFYDLDFVHPNFLATGIVWERFVQSCIHKEEHGLMDDLREINTARNHRTRFAETEAHRNFLAAFAGKVKRLQELHPHLDMEDELRYFSGNRES